MMNAEKAKGAGRPADAGGRIRTFVAVSLPDRVVAALAGLQEKLREFGIAMRYTAPENIHLTLKFLGDVRAADADAIGGHLEQAAAGFAPIRLEARGMGVFPGARRPRVLWTGVKGETGRLESLQRAVEARMAAMGFEKENRPFSAHLTLGRFRGRADPVRIADAIREFGGFASSSFEAASIELFQSTLTPKGPVYKVLSSHRLSGKA